MSAETRFHVSDEEINTAFLLLYDLIASEVCALRPDISEQDAIDFAVGGHFHSPEQVIQAYDDTIKFAQNFLSDDEEEEYEDDVT